MHVRLRKVTEWKTLACLSLQARFCCKKSIELRHAGIISFLSSNNGKGHLHGSWKVLFESMVSWSLQWENISGNGFWYLKFSVPTFLVTSNNLSKASKRGMEESEKVSLSAEIGVDHGPARAKVLSMRMNWRSLFISWNFKLRNLNMNPRRKSEIQDSKSKFKFKHEHIDLVPQYIWCKWNVRTTPCKRAGKTG